jgi:predicted nucleic acid-binding Zn ribbon protein
MRLFNCGLLLYSLCILYLLYVSRLRDRIQPPMQKAGDLLGSAVRRMKRPEATVAWLASAWPTIVGKMLAAHTRPLRCENGLLEIAADRKDWKSQLEPMTHEFCARINQAWGGRLVTEVKFVGTARAAVKPGASKPGPKHASRESDNEHLPFIRRRK